MVFDSSGAGATFFGSAGILVLAAAVAFAASRVHTRQRHAKTDMREIVARTTRQAF